MIQRTMTGMRWGLAALALAAQMALAEDAAPALTSGGKLAVVGDSITEQKLYSKYIELYLAACTPELKVQVAQFGWSGERAPGFAGRMDNDMAWFKPDVVTTCYGMNDGSYTTYTDAIGKTYSDAMGSIVTRLKKAGALVVVGSPGAVDTRYYNRPNNPADVYNDNLGHLRDLARDCATSNAFPFANVHDAMMKAMADAKAALGADYDVCGRDGVHPGPNGHLVMAYAFLKALELKGDIGTVTLAMKDGKATATEGHTVLASQAGKVDLESRRYPFCFTGDETASGGTRSILPYVPFNADLNRFVLKVTDLPWDKAKVTWGPTSKVFTKAELEQGVNLAAAFIPNPFNEAFAKVELAVGAKQALETTMVKDWITRIPNTVRMLDNDKDVERAMREIVPKFVAKREALQQAVTAAVVPVRHTLTIEAATN